MDNPFAEKLARDALAASLEGRLLERSLVHHFLERQGQITLMRDRLHNRMPTSEALFTDKV